MSIGGHARRAKLDATFDNDDAVCKALKIESMLVRKCLDFGSHDFVASPSVTCAWCQHSRSFHDRVSKAATGWTHRLSLAFRINSAQDLRDALTQRHCCVGPRQPLRDAVAQRNSAVPRASGLR